MLQGQILLEEMTRRIQELVRAEMLERDEVKKQRKNGRSMELATMAKLKRYQSSQSDDDC